MAFALLDFAPELAERGKGYADALDHPIPRRIIFGSFANQNVEIGK
jgi:hypothetical protein